MSRTRSPRAFEPIDEVLARNAPGDWPRVCDIDGCIRELWSEQAARKHQEFAHARSEASPQDGLPQEERVMDEKTQQDPAPAEPAPPEGCPEPGCVLKAGHTGGHYRPRGRQGRRRASLPPVPRPRAPQPARAPSAAVASRQSQDGGLSFEASIHLSFAELADWPAEWLSALFRGAALLEQAIGGGSDG